MEVGVQEEENHMAEQWVHTELCFNCLVETRTETSGAVCMGKCVCVCLRAHMHLHML